MKRLLPLVAIVMGVGIALTASSFLLKNTNDVKAENATEFVVDQDGKKKSCSKDKSSCASKSSESTNAVAGAKEGKTCSKKSENALAGAKEGKSCSKKSAVTSNAVAGAKEGACCSDEEKAACCAGKSENAIAGAKEVKPTCSSSKKRLESASLEK